MTRSLYILLPLFSIHWDGSKEILSCSELPQLQTSVLWTHKLDMFSDGWLKASVTTVSFLRGIEFVSCYCHIQEADKYDGWYIKKSPQELPKPLWPVGLACWGQASGSGNGTQRRSVTASYRAAFETLTCKTRYNAWVCWPMNHPRS